jgi:hypothetical protein
MTRRRMATMSKTNYDHANEVILALIQRIDPDTQDPLPPDSILHRAPIMRALMTASSALQDGADRAARRSMLPSNVGRPWSKEEEDTLIAAFKSKEPVTTIAARHGRTVRSIESRLEKLGLITAAQRITVTHGQSFLNKGVKDE